MIAARRTSSRTPLRRLVPALPLALWLAVAPAGGSRAGDDPAPPPPATAAKVATDPPEWLAMLVDILKGSQLGPGDGWFRAAVAKTRFTWDATRARLDKDGDGSVARAEFAGPDADFARLDRDRDGALTAADFDFSPHALAPSPGVALFYMADRDGDGKVSRQEFEGAFRALDSGNAGFLSQDDLRRAFTPSPAPRLGASPPRPSGPSRWTLVKGLARQEIGSLQPGPEVDDPAPPFTLRTADGDEAVSLSGLVGSKPVVLVFGNFSCGPFRGQAGNVEKLHLRYKDRANFAMVYVREAHPTDGWQMESNDRAGVSLRQPRTYDERVGVARSCGKALAFGFPMLVDTLDDAVGARYSGMPGRLYLIDRSGKVAYKSGRGPFGFKPAELEQSLILLLGREAGEKASNEGEKPDPDLE